MKIAITGASGFLGKWLADELRSREHQVVGCDLHGPTVAAIDLRVPGNARAWLDREVPDLCIHTAAQVGRLFGDQDIAHTVEANAKMTTLIAKACGELGIRMCYFSTSEIYGDQIHAMCDEYEGPFDLPHNLYGVTKRWGEEACQLFCPRDLLIFRPSMPYGPGVPPGRGRAAINNILWQASNLDDIPVHRGSERSWVWVGDAVKGMALAIEKGDGIYNVGRDDDPREMLEIAQIACDMVGASRDLIQMVDPPGPQTLVKRLSTQRLEDLGWKPEVELETGMQRVLEWVQRFNEKEQLVA